MEMGCSLLLVRQKTHCYHTYQIEKTQGIDLELTLRSHFLQSFMMGVVGVDFPGDPMVKTLPSNTVDLGSIPGLCAEILHVFQP